MQLGDKNIRIEVGVSFVFDYELEVRKIIFKVQGILKKIVIELNKKNLYLIIF